MEVKGVRIRVLGKGTYGVVYLLKTNIPTSQLYAVKSADEEMASTLHKEQEILQQFSGCPNIVRCFGGFTSVQCGRKIFNLFLEYVSGGCLADLMKEYGGKIPERHAKFYARMILEGLVDIHRKGYIHSDLKPRNILVFPSQDGISLDTLKIADFGTGVFAPTIHRNVKCSNILLTESLHAKLSDFRLSKAFTLEGDSHVYTVVADTPGYVDPDKVVVFMYQ
ncbi:hypothetical protein QUC31_011725 [Theobroma cacao]